MEVIVIRFSFHNPTKIHFGQAMIKMIGKELREAGQHKVLLICGSGSIRANGVYDQVCNSLRDNGITWIEAWGVKANPDLEKTREIINIAKSEAVDSVLAVGGGSVIDTAKAVCAGFYLSDVWDAFCRRAEILRALPLYTVLTISATGSEMNGNAVITNEKERKKWAISSLLLYPKVSVVDPDIQVSLPPQQTVNGALDAIAHILEYYFMDSELHSTRAIDTALIKSIIESTDFLIRNPQDMAARANLAWCATLALNGISGAGMQGGDWACHQIEHALSAYNPKISHGEGLGVIFPAWIEFMAERDPIRFYQWAKQVWNEDTPSMGVKRFREKIKAWGSATSLRELGFQEADLPELCNILSINPMIGTLSRFGTSEIEAILMLAY